MKPHLPVLKSLYALFSNDLHRLKNHYRGKKLPAISATLAVVTIAAFFIILEFVVAEKLFQHIMNQVHLEGLRYVLLAKLLQMVYLIFTVLLVYSNIVMSISSFFLSPEIDMFHSRPVPEKSIFIYSFFETFIRSSWMFIAFGVPILLAYGSVMKRTATFFHQTILIILPSLILPAAIGSFIGIGLIYIFSPRRTQRVFFIMGVFLAAGLILVFRLMKPEQLVDPIGVDQVNFYLDTLRIPTISWLPTTWASEGIAAYGEGRIAANQQYALYLWIASFVSIVLTYISFKLLWWRARSKGHSSDALESGKKLRTIQSKEPTLFRCSLIYRDIILFSRDAGQWSQVIVIAALVVIYIFNFKNLPYELYGFQYSMSFVSVSASGLILSALLARFGFPSVSIEGKSFWLLKTSPINWRKYLWQKYLFLVIPTLFVGLTLVWFSVRVLDAAPSLVLKCILAESAIAISCTGLAIGIGARNPRFDLNDAAMVAVSASGLWYMILAIATIATTVSMVILPDLMRYMSFGWRWLRLINHADRVIVWIILAIVTFSITFIPMEMGIRHLKKIDQ